ncbi:MAG: biotin/lipoyl-containing protein [Dethiobacteria bacterium]|nr:biotin/lipoyl-containing protein [Dethiobacteria bacterium]
MKLFKVTVDGQPYTVQVEELSGSTPIATSGTVDNKSVTTAPQAGTTTQTVAHEMASAQQNQSTAKAVGAVGSLTVKAPMPGSVLEVKVKEGDVVEDGAVLIILEAMKMENELTAAQAGTVSSVLVKKGDTVNSGDPLIILS